MFPGTYELVGQRPPQLTPISNTALWVEWGEESTDAQEYENQSWACLILTTDVNLCSRQLPFLCLELLLFDHIPLLAGRMASLFSV